MTYEPAFQDTDKSLLQDLTELVGAVFHHGKLLPPRSDRGRRSCECFSIHFRQNELGQLILTFNSPLSFPSSYCLQCKGMCTQTSPQAEMGGWQLLAEEGDRPLGKSHFPSLAQECFSMNSKSKQTERYLLCKAS